HRPASIRARSCAAAWLGDRHDSGLDTRRAAGQDPENGMDHSRNPFPTARQIAAAQAWWREAGVDFIFHDEPQSWLSEDGAPTPGAPSPAIPDAAAEPAEARIGGDPSDWPQDLATFRRWWMEHPSLDI